MVIVMATITVKNIPDELYDLVKQSAKAQHRSINSEIIACLERSFLSKSVDVTTTIARARKLREITAGYLLTDEDITRAKNAGRP